MLRLLRIIDSASVGSSPYNNFTLPFVRRFKIFLISRLPINDHSHDCGLSFYSANGSFLRLIKLIASKLCMVQIVHLHSPHMIVAYLLAKLWKKEFQIPVIYTVHSSYDNYKIRHLICIVLGFLYLDKMVFCSNSSRQSFLNNWFFRFLLSHAFLHDKSSVITNGVNLEYIGSYDSNNIISSPVFGSFNIIFVGRLIELKRVEMLIKAFSLLSEDGISLHIVGTGPDYEKLSAIVQGIDAKNKVLFHGEVSRNGVYSFLSNSNVFVNLSAIEGMPVAVLEASAFGLPLLLSAIPPHLELKELGYKNVRYTSGSVEEISQDISNLINHSEITKPSEEFLYLISLERMIARYEQLYSELI